MHEHDDDADTVDEADKADDANVADNQDMANDVDMADDQSYMTGRSYPQPSPEPAPIPSTNRLPESIESHITSICNPNDEEPYIRQLSKSRPFGNNLDDIPKSSPTRGTTCKVTCSFTIVF